MDATPGRPPPPEPTRATEWLNIQGRRCSINELHDPRVMHSAHSDLTTIAGLLGYTVIVVVARLWDRLGTDGLVGALVVVAVLAALVLLGIARERPSRMLVAKFRGELVVIADDRDRRRFRDAVRMMRQR
jgi:O-antigen ligase